MTDTDHILNDVGKIVVDHLGLEKMPHAGETLDDLGADSLDIVEIAMAVEEDLRTGEVPDGVLDKWRTVGDIVDFVRKSREG